MTFNTKNDEAWAHLFSKYRILDKINCEECFHITAGQINEFREARLMTKFDHRVNLPEIFYRNNLAILPTARGSYVISHFEAYENLSPIDDGIVAVSFPDYIESIDHENITSEAIALSCAYLSGILADFLEDDNLFPTVSGRMGSGNFSFFIERQSGKRDFKVEVNKAQIEIDGGFEGLKQLALIEAKNFISEDFIIRQLYYPYRLWNSKTSKDIIPIYMVYSNGLFSLYQYAFKNPDCYNSLVLVKARRYSLDVEEVVFADLVDVFKVTQVVEEPRLAFPQADNFKRIINLCELLFENDMTRDDITLNYAFDPRQTNYYTDAGRYLGLIDKRRDEGQVVYSLTDGGENIIQSRYKERQLGFVKSILEHRVFNEVFRFYVRNNEMPAKKNIIQIMRNANLYRIKADSTYTRRASTVASWVNWVVELPG